MTFFIVKAFDEATSGNLVGAFKTLTSGIQPEVTTVEDDLGDAVKAFLAAFAPAEAKSILTSLTTALSSGIQVGLGNLQTATVANAETGVAAAGAAITTDLAGNAAGTSAAPSAEGQTAASQ